MQLYLPAQHHTAAMPASQPMQHHAGMPAESVLQDLPMSTCSGVAPASSSKGRHLAPAALRLFKTANSADLMALQQQATL